MKKIITILICVVMVIMLCGCIGSVNKYSGTYYMNETAKIGKIEVTLMQATSSGFDFFDLPAEGNTYVMISMRIKINREIDLDEDTYFLGYCDGVFTDVVKQHFLYEDDTKKSVSGTIVFEVPVDWEVFEIDYSPVDYYGGSNCLKFEVKHSDINSEVGEKDVK